jgi:hypothetical protein
MKMTRIEELWQSIRLGAERTAAHESGWTFVRIDPEHPFDVYAGVDSTGSAILALGINQPPPAIDVDTGALEYVRLQRNGGRWIMGLRLETQGLEVVFGRLCQDLADAAACVTTESALVSLFRERLLLWKRLFRDGGSGLLEKFQIKGLMAELLALEEFLGASLSDPIAPLMAWTGPAGASQDFVFATYAVEVKAVSPIAETVTISSAEQLDAHVPLELRVSVLREASPVELNALTLPMLICRVESMLTNTPSASATFRNKLLEAGYIEHDYYTTIAFTLMDTRRYIAGPGFPRLIPTSLPPGIPSISYSILFTAITPFLNTSYSNAS